VAYDGDDYEQDADDRGDADDLGDTNMYDRDDDDDYYVDARDEDGGFLQ